MKTQTIRLPSNNALRCRALAQENAAVARQLLEETT